MNWKNRIKASVLGIMVFSLSLHAQVFDAIVDVNGTGDYTTLQAAFDAIEDNAESRTILFIKNGTYNEKVHLTSTKTNVSLIGENVEKVLIVWDDYEGKEDGMNGAESYTFLAEGPDFYMENVTVQNNAGRVGQAVAIRTTGDQMVFKNCRFLGNQDTYYAHKNRQYNYKCFIEGNTDFIYGDATGVFDSCEVHCLTGGQYITAPADTKLRTQFSTRVFLHGLLFRYCDITAADGVSGNSYYLGRPWQPESSSVYLWCTLGNHIKPQGWSTWSDDNHLSSYFGEYASVDTDGNAVDVSQRVDWSYQVTEAQATSLYALNFFLRKNYVEWDPVPMTQTLAYPTHIALNGTQLSWDAVESAVGYVVMYNGTSIGITETNSITLDQTYNETELEVVTVSDFGSLSDGNVADPSTALPNIKAGNDLVKIYRNQIMAKEPVNLEVFLMNGKRFTVQNNITSYALSQVPQGAYLLKITDKNGDVFVQKIVH